MANAGYDLRQTAAAIGVLGDMGIQKYSFFYSSQIPPPYVVA